MMENKDSPPVDNNWLMTRNIACIEKAVRLGLVKENSLTVDRNGMLHLADVINNRYSTANSKECTTIARNENPTSKLLETLPIWPQCDVDITQLRALQRESKSRLESILSKFASRRRLPTPFEKNEATPWDMDETSAIDSAGIEKWWLTLDTSLRPYLSAIFYALAIAYGLEQGRFTVPMLTLYQTLSLIDGAEEFDREAFSPELKKVMAGIGTYRDYYDLKGMEATGLRLQEYLVPRRILAEELVALDIDMREALDIPSKAYRAKVDLAFQTDDRTSLETIRDTYSASLLIQDDDDRFV